MDRPLTGLKIGLSLSETEDMDQIGFREEDIAALTVSLAKRLISLGAAVVLGHQWRPNGIMDSIVSFTQVYRSELGSPDAPIIYNLMAAPDLARISKVDRDALKGVLSIEETIHDPKARLEPDPEVRRRMNLRRMREKIADLCDARICLGGKMKQVKHRTHGVIEEAGLTIERLRPVFFCGLLNGSTALLIQLLRQDITVGEATKKLSRHGGTRCNGETTMYLKKVARLGEEEYARLTELRPEEQAALFAADSLDVLLPIIAAALSRRQKRLHQTTSSASPVADARSPKSK